MIGLDTNVIVRYIVQDEPSQAAKATELIEGLSGEAPGYVTLITVVELVWVLQSCYQASRVQIVEVLESLLRTRELVVERAETVWQALRTYAASQADLADCLIERSAHAAGCEGTYTFDKAAAKSAGMVLLT